MSRALQTSVKELVQQHFKKAQWAIIGLAALSPPNIATTSGTGAASIDAHDDQTLSAVDDDRDMLRSKDKRSVADREKNLQNQAALNRVPDVQSV